MFCSSGAEWTTLNTAQKQLRGGMKLLYGTPRGLLKLRIGFSVKGKSYESLFALQVRYNSGKTRLALDVPTSQQLLKLRNSGAMRSRLTLLKAMSGTVCQLQRVACGTHRPAKSYRVVKAGWFFIIFNYVFALLSCTTGWGGRLRLPSTKKQRGAVGLFT